MANPEHVELLKRGVIGWNQWREQNPNIQVDLRDAFLEGLRFCSVEIVSFDSLDTRLVRANFRNCQLSGANFSHAQLGEADFTDSCLRKANFDYAVLANADFRAADMICASFRRVGASRVNFSEAALSKTTFVQADLAESNFSYSELQETCFHRADLMEARFENANLTSAKLPGAWLKRANLRQANLRNASLIAAQAVGADFSGAQLTGACIQNWIIDHTTQIDRTLCEYCYQGFASGLKKFVDRRPSNGKFKSGEFAALYQKALDTVDLIFKDGIDWQAFFATFQELRQKYDDTEINIQAIEKKSGGAFVVRLEVEESLDKVLLQQRWNDTYEENQQLRTQLLKTEGKLEGYKEQLDNFQQKVLKGMNAPKYDMRGAQIAGGVADTVNRSQYGGIINNYGSNAEDITRLLTALRDQAQTFPTDQKDDANDTLDLLERDLTDEQPDQGRIGRRLKKLVALGTAIGTIASGAAAVTGDVSTFTDNVIELTEQLGIPVEQVQLPASGTP